MEPIKRPTRIPAMNDIVRPRTGQTAKVTATRQQSSATVRPTASRLVPPKRHNILAYVQITIVTVVAIGVSLLAQNLPLGEIAVAAYGIIALLRRIPAVRSFILSLVALALTGVCVVISATFLAEHFAAYTFLFLIISLLSVVRESRWAAKVEKSAVNNTQA